MPAWRPHIDGIGGLLQPGSKPIPDRALARQRMLEEQLSKFQVHCCPNALCPARTEDFLLQDADRLSEDADQLMLCAWRSHVLRARHKSTSLWELSLSWKLFELGFQGFRV